MTEQSKSLIEAALSYLRAGLSILPCTLPKKEPAFRFLPKDDAGKRVWEPWQRKAPTEDDVNAWFASATPPQAIGIIGGAVSGNLEVIDIDDATLIKPWCEAVSEADPVLFKSLVAEKTLRGRLHAFYKCEAEVPGSQKLAMSSLEDGQKGLIETKAEAGYVCVAPSPGYTVKAGKLTDIPTITKAQRDLVIQISRSFTKAAVIKDAPRPKTDRAVDIDGDRPGDEYNRSGDWRALVQSHGWQLIRRHGDTEAWRRPGKDQGGISATWNHVPNAFYVFSTNCFPLEDQTAYSPFALLAILDYRGDYSEAAKAIRGAMRAFAPDDNQPPPQTDDDAPCYIDNTAPELAPHPSEDGSNICDMLENQDFPCTPKKPDHLSLVPDNPAANKRPNIFAGDDDLGLVLDRTWHALALHNSPPSLFNSGDSIVRVALDIDGQTAMRHQCPNAMREHMARAARWYKLKPATKTKPAAKYDVKAPLDVAQVLIAGDHSKLPALNRLISAPIVAPSGRFVASPGYDEETRTYYIGEDIDVSSIPDDPSREEINEARDLILKDLIVDFPFMESGQTEDDFYYSPDRSNALGMFILPFAREIIDGPTPLHLIEKSTPGSGASLIFQVLGRMVSGGDPSIITEANGEDEWRKRITSTLMSSPEIIAVDNLRKRLDSSAFAAALTASVWQDRRLGSSENVRLPVKAVWIATGNNPGVSNEIARRCVSIRIDPGLERPWEREPAMFKHPKLLPWVHENRPRLIRAVLTLIRAWFVDDCPSGDESLGSYEEWARVIGGILRVAGVEGFLKNRTSFYERADREASNWRTLIQIWWDTYGSDPVKTKNIWEIINDHDIPFYLGSGGDHAERIRVGKQITTSLDRRFTIEGRTLMLRKGVKKQGAWLYQLVELAEDNTIIETKSIDEKFFD